MKTALILTAAGVFLIAVLLFPAAVLVIASALALIMIFVGRSGDKQDDDL